MGGSVSTLSNTSSNFDVCYQAFIKHLIDVHSFTIKDFSMASTTDQMFKSLYKTSFDDKTIFKCKDVYMFKLSHEIDTRVTDCMFEPFIAQMTHSTSDDLVDTITLDRDYTVQLFRDRVKKKYDVFIIGITRMNWCKPLCFAICKENSENNSYIIHAISTIKPNALPQELTIALQMGLIKKAVHSDEENIELRKANVVMKLEKQYIEACEKDQDACNQIKLNAQKKTKLGLGKFLLLKIIQYAQTKNFDDVSLECHLSLYDYYSSFGFDIGASSNVSKRFLKTKNTKDIKYFQALNKLYKDTHPDFILNPEEDTIKMHININKVNFSSLYDHLSSYIPNIKYIIDSNRLFGATGVLNNINDQVSIQKLMERSRCLLAYLDGDPASIVARELF